MAATPPVVNKERRMGPGQAELLGYTHPKQTAQNPARVEDNPITYSTNVNYEGDVEPPDTTKVLVVFTPGLVAEKSDAYNWSLLERRRYEGGKHAGKWGWKRVGFYRTPGQAATRALRMLVEGGLQPGAHSLEELAKHTEEVEVRLRAIVEPAIREEVRREVLEHVLGVVRGEEDKRRVQKLLEGK